jgi:hypothetical protein
MEKLKDLGSILIGIYMLISFFSGLFFYGQSKVECIEQNGFWKGVFLGCDVIESRFGPANPPSYVTSQLKGLIWPYYLFFDVKDSERPISSNSPSSEYLFEKTVEQQVSSELIKALARCDALLSVAAEVVKRSNKSLHRNFIGSANSLKHMAESLLLVNKYSYIDAGTALSSDMKRELIEEVTTEVQKYTNHYIKLYDGLLAESANMVKQGRVHGESVQKTYQEDVTNCIEMSVDSNPQPKPLTKLLDTLSEPRPPSKITEDITKHYPYKISLGTINMGLTDETFKETVMRCGGILQAFTNGVPNEGTKIPEPGKRFVELSLLGMSIHKEKLGGASQLSESEIDDIAAGRVMDEFLKHEKSYTPWLEYKNTMLSNNPTAEASFNLEWFVDEKQCLKLTTVLKVDYWYL